MKVINYFIFLSMSILFISCSGENEVLEGQYIGQTVELFDCTDSSLNTIKDLSQEPCTWDSPIGCNYQSFDFINETQVIYTTSQVDNIFGGGILFEDIDTANYTINDKTLIVCTNTKCDSTEFSLSGNTLTLMELLEGGTVTCEREGIFIKK